MPNLKLQTIKFTRKIIEDHLPELQRKLFIFEAKDIPEAPRVLVQFLGKCIRCFKEEGVGSSTQTWDTLLKIFVIKMIKQLEKKCKRLDIVHPCNRSLRKLVHHQREKYLMIMYKYVVTRFWIMSNLSYVFFNLVYNFYVSLSMSF